MRALYFLEEAGIPVVNTLIKYTQHIQNILGLPMAIAHNEDLINYWIGSVWQVPPTWNNLIHILRILKLDDLAKQIESYLSGATNLSPVRRTDGEEKILRLEMLTRRKTSSILLSLLLANFFLLCCSIL